MEARRWGEASPCTLIGSGEPWKTVDVIKGVNWLTYEGGKFSTSQRRGVFLDQALALLPSDYWRWWLASNAPESNDTDFTFERFAADVNHDLADTFGNLVNRILKFVESRYGGIVPLAGEPSAREFALTGQVDIHLDALRAHHASRSFRKATGEVRQLWRLANGYLAGEAPWTSFIGDPERTAVVVRAGVSLVAIAAQAAWPFIPAAAEQVLQALGYGHGRPAWASSASITRAELLPVSKLGPLPPLFEKLLPDWVEAQTARYAGH